MDTLRVGAHLGKLKAVGTKLVWNGQFLVSFIGAVWSWCWLAAWDIWVSGGDAQWPL